MTKIKTCYVNIDRMLVLTETNEVLRRATRTERTESGVERTGTGNFSAAVAEQTLARKAKKYMADCEMNGYR